MKNVPRLFLGLVATALATSAVASDANRPAGTTAACSQEMRMQTVWTAGPRSQQMARVEKQPVTVCDGKVVKSTPQVARTDRE